MRYFFLALSILCGLAFASHKSVWIGGASVTPWASVHSITNSYATSGVASNVFNYEYTASFGAGIWAKIAASAPGSYLIGTVNNQGPGGWTLNNGSSSSGTFIPVVTMLPNPYNGLGRIDQTASASITDTTNWHFYSFSYDGTGLCSHLKIYVDGSLVASTCTSNAAFVGTMVNASNPFVLGGAWNNTGTSYTGKWAGKLDLAIVFGSYAPSAGDWAALYNGGVPPDPSTLSLYSNVVGWYPIGEGSDTTTDLIDLKGANNLNGTTTSVTFSTDHP